jgi:hypothetical protein
LLALMVGLVFRFLYLQARRDLFSRRATARHARNL